MSLSLCHNGVKSGRFNETVAEVQSRLLQGLAGELPGPGPLLIGVSGGGDSVALLRLLSAMAPGRDWHLWVAHVNHGLRPEAGAEAEFVRGLARDLGHEFLLHRAGGLKPGLSMEESCRRTRHNWLAGQAAKVGARATVLGHTLDDQAETLLCRALSGSGPTGLAGMRPYQDGLWRPLLNTRRDDLRGYLKALGQNWQSDPSNLDLGPLRNRVRHRILPLAKDLVNNKADEALARLAGILQSEEDYWDERVRALWAAHGSRQGISCFVQNEAQNLHRAELGRLMRWIAGRMLDRGQHLLSMHLEQLWELWAGEPGRKLTLPLGLCAYREHLGLRLVPDLEPEEFRIELDGPERADLPQTGQSLEVLTGLKPLSLESGRATAWIPEKEIRWPLLVRGPQKGDEFQPIGSPGKKMLNRFMIDRKVPVWFRPRTPVLCDAKGILWLAPWAVAERARKRPDCNSWICVRLIDRNQDHAYTENPYNE